MHLGRLNGIYPDPRAQGHGHKAQHALDPFISNPKLPQIVSNERHVICHVTHGQPRPERKQQKADTKREKTDELCTGQLLDLIHGFNSLGMGGR